MQTTKLKETLFTAISTHWVTCLKRQKYVRTSILILHAAKGLVSIVKEHRLTNSTTHKLTIGFKQLIQNSFSCYAPYQLPYYFLLFPVM